MRNRLLAKDHFLKKGQHALLAIKQNLREREKERMNECQREKTGQVKSREGALLRFVILSLSLSLHFPTSTYLGLCSVATFGQSIDHFREALQLLLQVPVGEDETFKMRKKICVYE